MDTNPLISSFRFVQLQCPKEIHQLVIEADNLVKTQARLKTEEVIRSPPLRRIDVSMKNSNTKRVAQWVESHSTALALPQEPTFNTDCEASCEYTG